MKTFSFTGARKIVFGNGSFAGLGEHLAELKVSRPLIVLDGNLAAVGFGGKVAALMEKAKIGYVLFDKAVPEPPTELANEGAKLALRKKCNGVVGIGGGSSMDLAKAISVLATNRGKAEDYLGLNKVPGPGLPKIMVPTTAGTGSEVTFTAVFSQKTLKKKLAMHSPYNYAELALLDPELTLTCPHRPTATTGIDAICHAIESYTSIHASPMTEMMSLEAIRLISKNLRTAVHNGTNIEAREAMLLGSLYAGLAFANAKVTAVHSLSNPLSAKYGISHGLANTIVLPRVMAFNLHGALEKFVDIAEIMGEIVDDLPLREAAYLSVEAVESLIEDCGVFTTLAELGIPEEDFPELARMVMTHPTLANNPCKITPEEMVEIYRACYASTS